MIEATPRVSVIMPIFNGEAFLDEAIDSAMAQSMDDFELLLCDDGSTDGSTSIARSWAARHPDKVRYLEHPGHANMGPSHTRNVGMAAARGQYVAFLDADDVWHPRKLAEQIAVMEAHPEVGMVCGTVRYWASWDGGEDVLVPTGHAQNRVIRSPETSLAVYPLGSAAAPCPSDMLVRRAAVEQVGGFDEQFVGDWQLYEDQTFLSKLYLTQPVFFSDAVWLDYRQHADSCVASANREGLYHLARYYFLDWFEDYLDGLPDGPPPRVRAAVSRALRPYRRPVVHALLSSPGRVAVKGRSLARRLRSALSRRGRSHVGGRAGSPAEDRLQAS
jgi:glycosyltransferase involved in cell wall biosynthesis